jgi:hypothetical protein
MVHSLVIQFTICMLYFSVFVQIIPFHRLYSFSPSFSLVSQYRPFCLVSNGFCVDHLCAVCLNNAKLQFLRFITVNLLSVTCGFRISVTKQQRETMRAGLLNWPLRCLRARRSLLPNSGCCTDQTAWRVRREMDGDEVTATCYWPLVICCLKANG